MKPILAALLRLLELERLEDNFFRGESRDIGSRRVFGGQVLGQALSAASYTVDKFTVHSLHAYFLRAGDVEAPILYEVDRARGLATGRFFDENGVLVASTGPGRADPHLAAARGMNAGGRATRFWIKCMVIEWTGRLLSGATRLK